MKFGFLLLAFISLNAFSKECVTNVESLKKAFGAEEFSLQWIETTADDGKPLKMDIKEVDSKLYMEFDKTKEGLWASGNANICKDDGVISAEITKEQIKLGKAAPWVMRMSMKSGATFKLQMVKPKVLKISTFGWSGEFVPR